jgi:hypothetical protein
MERGAHDGEERERGLRIALPRDHRIGRGFLRIARPADSPAEPSRQTGLVKDPPFSRETAASNENRAGRKPRRDRETLAGPEFQSQHIY